MSDHHEIEALLPGYSLGCLDSEEEEQCREHLALCTSCREELASLRGVVGELAASLAPVPTPPSLEDALMSALERSQPPARRRRRRLPALATAAIALIAVLGAGNIVQWQRSRALGPGPAALLTFTLSSRGSEAFGTVVLDPEDNEGVLAVRGLAALGAASSYQLWLVKGSLRASGGLFSVDAHGYGSLLLDVPPELRGFDSFLVTREPKGGSPVPSGAPVMEGHR